jgi:dTDP-4-amino-4,6-dideoxygalactose transaminase
MTKIPFNRPFLVGTELGYVREAAEVGGLASGGPFTARCEAWLANATGAKRALLSHSGTGALEAAMMLADLGPGDEAIMPSFAYPTMATAAVRQGATPVFVDVDPRTLNLDPAEVKKAVGPRTKAIVAVHYGGVGCEMDELLGIAAPAGLTVIEDAAHCLLATYRDRPLGTLGDLGTFSFHHTKNLSSGEGGALLVNDCWSGPRSSGRRAPTAPASSAARSIATPGSTSAPPLPPASSPPPSSGASWRRPRRSPDAAWRSGIATTRRSPGSKPRGWRSGRWCPTATPTTATSTT